MKQKDILLLVVVAIVSGVIALLVSNLLIATPKNRSQHVEVVDKISSDFPKPDPKYFSSDAVNPAQPVQIGTSTNPNPFTGGQ